MEEKEEKDKQMLEMAIALKKFCEEREGDCCGCIFQDTNPRIMCKISPSLNSVLPEAWTLY